MSRNQIIRLVVLVLISLILSAPSLSAQQEYYVTNGQVNDFELIGDKLYIGGAFTSLTPARGSFATLGTDGTFAATLPRVGGGKVKDIVSDGAGGWYICGSFTEIDDYSIQYLAHIFSTGVLDTAWAPNPNDVVNSIFLDGTTLYVGGEFTTITGGTPRIRIASFNTTTGALTDLDIEANNSVRVVYASSGNLFVGGLFSDIDGFPRGSLASINPNGGTPAGVGSVNSFNVSTNGYVESLVVIGTEMYFGGVFASVNGSTFESRNNLASVTLAGAVSTWNPSPDGRIIRIVNNGTQLFVLGSYANISSSARAGAAKYDTTTNTLNALWDPQLDISYDINDAVVAGDGNVYLAGRIFSVDGDTATHIVGVNNTTGATVGFYPYFSGYINAIAADGTNLAVGGDFGGFETKIDRNNLAVIDLKSGEPTTFAPTVNGSVNVMLYNGTDLFLGGDFTQVNGQARSRAAAVNISTETLTSWNPNIDYSVRDMELNISGGGTILLSGDFTTVNGGGVTRNYFAEVDSTNGLATALFINPDSIVNTIEVDGDSVYLGGSFNNVNSTPRSKLARASLSTGVLDSWNPSADNLVFSMHIYDNSGTKTVYTAGSFNNVASTPRARIVEINTDATGTITTWDPVSGINPGLSLETAPFYILRNGNEVYLAGQNRLPGSTIIRPFIKFDSTTGLLDTNIAAGDGFGSSLYAATNQVYGGGGFVGAYDQPYQGYAVINGTLANIEPPAITGITQDGQTLTSTLGYWRGVPKVTYVRQWNRCNESGVACDPISGETGTTYVLTAADVGSTIQIAVTGTDSNNTPTVETGLSAVVDPLNTSLPSITGTAQQGQTLTAITGSWNGVAGLTFNYQWKRCDASGAGCVNISGATDSTYTLVLDDVSSTLRVRVSAQKNGSAANNAVDSTQTGVVSLAPTATPTVTPTTTPTTTATPEVSPSATPTVVVTITNTPAPTPACSLPAPSAKIVSGKITVKFPRATQITNCITSTIKASLSLTVGSRTKILKVKFKRVGTKKVAIINIKSTLKKRRGVLKLIATDTATGVVVSGVEKTVRTK